MRELEPSYCQNPVVAPIHCHQTSSKCEKSRGDIFYINGKDANQEEEANNEGNGETLKALE
ncbi:hypothetical protein E2C01_057949 [Portunus trituberculatus]|uniref:Uncharacterized protein n=1 Tax=Portunus trituberculatus TaxID=210409 RepID=A0A5B7H1C8_PORTR|nr:hypothetical protein [Portunus trituberculatus]